MRSRRVKRLNFFAQQLVVAPFCVISTVGTGSPDFPVRLTDKPPNAFASVTLFRDRSAQIISCVSASGAVSSRHGAFPGRVFSPSAHPHRRLNPVGSIIKRAISPHVGFLKGMLTDLACLLMEE